MLITQTESDEAVDAAQNRLLVIVGILLGVSAVAVGGWVGMIAVILAGTIPATIATRAFEAKDGEPAIVLLGIDVATRKLGPYLAVSLGSLILFAGVYLLSVGVA